MRISPNHRRRGSVTLEAVLIIPVAVMMIILSRFILEAMLHRHEVAVNTRGKVATAAIYKGGSSFLPTPGQTSGDCVFDESPFTARSGVTQTAEVSCARINGERGLSTEKPFFDGIRDEASPARWLIDDVDRTSAVRAYIGRGGGTMSMDRTYFLSTETSEVNKEVYIVADEDSFDHLDAPYEAAHDPAVWAKLNEEGTYQLFPNVFPSSDK